MNTELNQQELERYSRHFSVADIGLAGQKKLKQAKILCIGAGGIGSPLLQYLCAMGIGTIGIIDFDKVDLSNLQRQVLFNEQDLNKNKALTAKEKLCQLNSNTHINTYTEKLSAENAERIFRDYDLIIDGSDNYPTRYLSNDCCCLLNKPLIMASIYQFSGQLASYNYKSSACYRCLFPEAPPSNLIPNCSQAGVLGVVPGILATLAGLEAIKLLLELNNNLANTLLSFDGSTYNLKKFPFKKQTHCLCNKAINLKTLHPKEDIKAKQEPFEITQQQLAAMQKNNPELILIDVREDWERAINKLDNSIHTPLKELQEKPQPQLKNQTIVCYCKKGGRSKKAARLLIAQGHKNVFSLIGGIDAFNEN